MASIKISNTAVETNLKNVLGLVGYRQNANTTDLETVQITGNYNNQGLVSSAPLTVYNDPTEITATPADTVDRAIFSNAGVSGYGDIEFQSITEDVTIQANKQVTITSGSFNKIDINAAGQLEMNAAGAISLQSDSGQSFFYSSKNQTSSIASLKFYTINSANNKGHIEILSGGSHVDSKGIVLKSATEINVDLHSLSGGTVNAPTVGDVLQAKDTDGNIKFGKIILSQDAGGNQNSGLKYSNTNNGLGIALEPNKGLSISASGLAIDFSNVTSSPQSPSIGAPFLGVITAANAADARAVIGAIDGDDIGTYFKTSPTPFTLEFGPIAPGGTGGEVIASSSLSIANGSGIAITTSVTGTGNKDGNITIAADAYDAGGLGFQTITGKSKLSLNLTQLGIASPIPGAGVGKVGILMNAAGQTDGHKLEFRNTSSDPNTPAVELVTAPQSPDIVCIVNSNANLQGMDNGKAYVVPFDTYGQSPNGGYYTFNDADTDVAIDWNSYVEIQNDGKYMINAKVGMYNAEKGNNPMTPALTVWVEVSDGTPATLGDVNAPYDGTVHCIGSCQVNRDQNGFATVSGSTMLNLLEGDCIRVIVRSDSFGYQNQGDRPYFVYNDIDVGNGNSVTGHRPQLEIYKID